MPDPLAIASHRTIYSHHAGHEKSSRTLQVADSGSSPVCSFKLFACIRRQFDLPDEFSGVVSKLAEDINYLQISIVYDLNRGCFLRHCYCC